MFVEKMVGPSILNPPKPVIARVIGMITRKGSVPRAKIQ